ncbi:MAG: amino acid ABC transporter permease [Caldilineaceae bacterium]|nr:amino acid ABC transporter permease [Caldilineaceae bacterium]
MQQSIRDFPLWIVIIAVILAVGGLYALSKPEIRGYYANALSFIIPGAWITLQVTFLSYLLALIIGLFVGLMRLSANPILFHVATVYVEVMRGLPMLVIVLYAGFVVRPLLRDATGGLIDPSMMTGAIVGLGVGYGAFLSEVFRSGIQSISKGQIEAARSLGMTYTQAMIHVILPQAIRIILPPLGNDLIALLKDSALVAVLAIPDTLQLGRLWISRTFRAIEGYNTVALFYLGMTVMLSLIVGMIERRVRTGGH